MKKILFMLCGALTASVVTAQITLTEATSVPRIGDVFNYHSIANAENLHVSHYGANQEWDMSAVEAEAVYSHEYINITQSALPETPANLVCVMEEEMTAETYYTTSANSLVYNKIFIPEIASTSYTDLREVLKFPLTYNQKYNETFAGTLTNIGVGQTFDVNGTIEIKADGYGKLKLPSGTIDNTLRVIAVYNYTYSMDFPGFPSMVVAALKDTVYTWYNADTRSYIANYSVGYGDTGMGMQKMSATLQYLSSGDISTSNIKTISGNPVAVYPNPTQGMVNIAGTNETPKVKVYDMNGTLLLQEKSAIIDISAYSSGLYFMEIEGKKYKIMKK